MILPVAEHEYTYRYVIPAVPLVCLAAALTVRSKEKDALARPAAAARERLPEAPAESRPAEAAEAPAGDRLPEAAS
jgi:hypothetical protein